MSVDITAAQGLWAQGSGGCWVWLDVQKHPDTAEESLRGEKRATQGASNCSWVGVSGAALLTQEPMVSISSQLQVQWHYVRRSFTWNQPWWEYLHHRKRQMLPIRAFSPLESWLLNIYLLGGEPLWCLLSVRGQGCSGGLYSVQVVQKWHNQRHVWICLRRERGWHEIWQLQRLSPEVVLMKADESNRRQPHF